MNNDCNCGNGIGVVPGPTVAKKCQKDPYDGRIKLEYLPPSLGTDAEGQPFAPKQGAYYSTFVTYGANGAVYFYDARGAYAKLTRTLANLIIKAGENEYSYNGDTEVTFDLGEALGDEYYTKAQIDEMIGIAVTRLEAI